MYVSKKADRSQLWFDIPKYTELMEKIRDLDNNVDPEYARFRHKDMHKALLATFMLTGARVSEVVALHRRNITFTDYTGAEIIDYLVPRIDKHKVASVMFTLLNEKNQKQKIKKIPIQRSPLFGDAIDWIIDWYNTLPAKADTRVFKIERCAVWRLFKVIFGQNYFPHIMRHYVTSNDTIAGIHPLIIKQKLGWSSLKMYDVYAHMNTDDIKREFIRVYGVTPVEKVHQDVQAGKPESFKRVMREYGKDKQQFNIKERTLILEKKKYEQHDDLLLV